MAFVTSPSAKVTYTFRDESGSIGRTQLTLPSNLTVAAMTTAANDLAALMQTLSGAAIIGYDINVSVRQTAPATPLTDHKVEDKGIFNFLTAVGKVVGYEVPGFRGALENPDGSADDVAAITEFIAEVIGDAWVDSNGQDLVALEAGYARRRSTSKRQLPTNRRPT